MVIAGKGVEYCLGATFRAQLPSAVRQKEEPKSDCYLSHGPCSEDIHRDAPAETRTVCLVGS